MEANKVVRKKGSITDFGVVTFYKFVSVSGSRTGRDSMFVQQYQLPYTTLIFREYDDGRLTKAVEDGLKEVIQKDKRALSQVRCYHKILELKLYLDICYR